MGISPASQCRRHPHAHPTSSSTSSRPSVHNWYVSFHLIIAGLYNYFHHKLSRIYFRSPSMDRSTFATLPPELRDSIYDFVLQFPHDRVDLKDRGHGPSAGSILINASSYTRLGLLLACRQLHDEAVKRLYAANTFAITQNASDAPCEEIADAFITLIGESNAAEINLFQFSYTLSQGTFGNGQFRRSLRKIREIALRIPNCTVKVLLTFLDVYKSIAIRAQLDLQTRLREPGNAWIEMLEPITSASMENSDEVQDSMEFLGRHLRECKQDLVMT